MHIHQAVLQTAWGSGTKEQRTALGISSERSNEQDVMGRNRFSLSPFPVCVFTFELGRNTEWDLSGPTAEWMRTGKSERSGLHPSA